MLTAGAEELAPALPLLTTTMVHLVSSNAEALLVSTTMVCLASSAVVLQVSTMAVVAAVLEVCFLPQQLRGPGYGAAYGGINQGQQWNGNGGDWQYQEYDWSNGDQGDFGNAMFNGDFGPFDEGYYDCVQGFGHGYGGFGNQANQIFRRPRPTSGNTGRGRGGRTFRGGLFNHPGRGGQVQPLPSTEMQVAQNLTTEVVQNLSNTTNTLGLFNILDNAARPRQATTTLQVQPPPVAVVEQPPVALPVSEVVPAVADENGTDVARLKTTKNAKKLEKTLCFRCVQTGHMAIDCKAELCLYCEVATHASRDCPLLAMPKPTAVMYGLAHDALLFLDLRKNPSLRPKTDSGKLGRIRVSGGVMSDRQVVEELKWLVPGDHQWDITQLDSSSFRVVYPTKMDLARVRKIKEINVEGTPHTIHFENWATDDLNKWELTDVWVRFHRCPEDLRCDYLSLFALGSLVGKTKEVDMQFTRETGIVRQLISVINPKAMPDHVDHTFDGEGYVIPVEVEGNAGLVMEEANEVDDDSRYNGNGNGNSKEGLGHVDDSLSNVKSNQKVQKASDSGVAKEGADVNDLSVASLPFSLQVGQIECTSPPRISDRSPVVTSCEPVPFGINTPSKVGATLKGNHTNPGPRKSWFDMVQEDEAAERLTASAPPAVNHKDFSPTTVPLDHSVTAVTNQATRPTQLSGTTSASPSHGASPLSLADSISVSGMTAMQPEARELRQEAEAMQLPRSKNPGTPGRGQCRPWLAHLARQRGVQARVRLFLLRVIVELASSLASDILKRRWWLLAASLPLQRLG
ncbi:hypothetical protein ACQ4PT_061676 [Festuca glaucescens]